MICCICSSCLNYAINELLLRFDCNDYVATLVSGEEVKVRGERRREGIGALVEKEFCTNSNVKVGLERERAFVVKRSYEVKPL